VSGVICVQIDDWDKGSGNPNFVCESPLPGNGGWGKTEGTATEGRALPGFRGGWLVWTGLHWGVGHDGCDFR